MLIKEWVCSDKGHINALLSSSIHSWKITFDPTNVLIQWGVDFGKSGGSQSPASRPLFLPQTLRFPWWNTQNCVLIQDESVVTKWLIATGRPCSYHCKGSASAGDQGGPTSKSSQLAQTKSLALQSAKKISGNGITIIFFVEDKYAMTWFVKEICEGERKFTVHL